MRTPSSLLVSTLVCGLTIGAATGCGADSDPAPEPGRTEEAAAAHVHSDDHHHGEHASSASLERMLLTVKDLPQGYVAGAGHHHVATSGPAPPVAAACAPLAEVLGEHPAVQQDVHPQARTSFTKSHFGPVVTETVIDYGDEDLAAEAITRFDRAASECTTYVQSVTGPGAGAYGVVEKTNISGLDDGARITLEASGSDFAGIGWEVWVSQVDSRLLAVALRTARGGEAGDLPAVVRAAMARVRGF